MQRMDLIYADSAARVFQHGNSMTAGQPSTLPLISRQIISPHQYSMVGQPARCVVLESPEEQLPLGEPTETTATSPTSANQEPEEEARPRGDFVYLGIDFKPLLPPVLVASTALGWMCTMLVHVPLICAHTGLPKGILWLLSSFLHGTPFGCMLYCAVADPGQLRERRKRKVQLSDADVDVEKGQKLPERSHKSWQYPRPVRRYDHYCKWINNTIALLNHREFVLMLFFLTLVGVIGIVLDVYVGALMARSAFFPGEVWIMLHLIYCVVLLVVEVPIFRVHVGLVCRNELAKEWKDNIHFIANNTSQGDRVPVHSLDDDEYNELFDRGAFVYDPSKNRWDRGCVTNCLNFWCWPRWPADEKGDF